VSHLTVMVVWLLAAAASVAPARTGSAAQGSPARPAPNHPPTGHPSDDGRIRGAVLPLPAALRDGAGVVTLEQGRPPQALRPSRNGMVCLADRPGDSTFDVRCYHELFMPVLYRLRELMAEGVPDSALDGRMDAEIRAGRVKLPGGPTAGYRMLGPRSGYDPARAAVDGTIDAWQSLHLPYRTAAW
jgi:hypothetical protein